MKRKTWTKLPTRLLTILGLCPWRRHKEWVCPFRGINTQISLLVYPSRNSFPF